MKQTMLKYMIVAAVALSLSVPALAQQRSQMQRVRVSELEVERVGGDSYGGGELWVSFRTDVDKDFSRNSIMCLTPVLFSQNSEVELPDVWVMARRGEILLEREREYFTTEEMIVRPGGTIGYKFSMPYESWMNHSSLRIIKTARYCSEFFAQPSEVMLYDIVLAQEAFEPYYALAAPRSMSKKGSGENKSKKGSQKKSSCCGTIFIDFKVSSAQMLADFRQNTKENKKIRKSIDAVPQNTQIEKIELWGTCSPEGNYNYNAKLAEERAQTLKSYIQHEYSVSDDTFEITSTPEDWKGLAKLIRASSLDNKEDILSIIASNMNYSQKDAAMKRLPNYSLLLSVYYPQLRKVDYKVIYEAKSYTDEELAQIFTQTPEKLTQEELYRLAEVNGTLFREVVEYTVEKYPKSASANLNMATACLISDELDEAQKYLKRAAASLEIIVKTPTPILVATYYNSSAILQLKRGDTQSAQLLFGKAAVMGLEEGEKNLKIMEM